MIKTLLTTGALIALCSIAVPDALEPAPPPQSGTLPCESVPDSTPPPTTTPAPSAPRNLRIIGGGLEGIDAVDELDFESGPNAHELAAVEAPPQTAGTHAYYEALASRPDCSRAFSLRNAAQVEQYRRSKSQSAYISYNPANDPDPRRQDAMKIVIPEKNNSLPTQLWVPTGHTPRTNLLVTFDAWWGKEYHFTHTAIPTHKSWQIGSPNADIWTEVQLRFGMSRDDTSNIGWAAIRQYGDTAQGPNVNYSPIINGRNYGGNVIGPMVGEFGIAPETWTRFWVFFDLQPDGRWYRMSMWVADVNRGPVKIYEGLQVTPRKGPTPIEVSMDGIWGNVRVEYNTSHSAIAAGRVPLISYARNIVALKGINQASVNSLLLRPVR